MIYWSSGVVVNMPPCHGGDRGFESHLDRHHKNDILEKGCFFCLNEDMILNVSGRTDIVGFYMDWFVERWQAGFYDVQNPFYNKQVSRIYVKDVDMIVFCTKNPISLLDTIHLFDVPIMLQVTITGYHKDLEPDVMDKTLIIDAVKKLSKILGKENVCVRYDPIILNDTYTVDYHIKAFKRLCALLDGYVTRMIISFVDDYKNVRENKLIYHEPTKEELNKISIEFNEISKEHGMYVVSCMEDYDLGFSKEGCVPIKYAFEKTGKLFKPWKARKCGCATMVDVGYYNSCLHGCKYCYANYDEGKVRENYSKHDINSTMLIGSIYESNITVRKK